jgi:protein-tyrosine phosphatase
MPGPVAPGAVLFVCLGNICRSPVAAAVMRARLDAAGLASAVRVDSAATHAYRIDSPAHPETRRLAELRGYDLGGHRARLVVPGDFNHFELILAMDRQNLAALSALAPAEADGRLQLLMDFAPGLGVQEVPDPYGGPPEGFVRALDLIEAGVNGMLRRCYRI